MNGFKSLLAEAIGTFYLCFAGISAIVATAPPINSGIGLVGIALAHGLALSIAVNNFGGVSGAHVNPAVTCGMLVTGRISFGGAVGYILSQLIGAMVAAAAAKAIFPAEAVAAVKLGIPLPGNPSITIGVVLLVEFICTYLLITSVFGTAVDDRGEVVKIGGFGIGLTVAFDILACGPITGASMNPARSFGPAFIYGDFTLHWCYWVAPILGGVVAALVYDKILLSKD
jgi:aquaporin Z